MAVLIHKGKRQVFRWVSDEDTSDGVPIKPGKTTTIKLELQNIFPVGVHFVDILVKSRDREEDYAIYNNSAKFEVVNNSGFKYRTLWQPRQNTSIKIGDTDAK